MECLAIVDRTVAPGFVLWLLLTLRLYRVDRFSGFLPP